MQKTVFLIVVVALFMVFSTVGSVAQKHVVTKASLSSDDDTIIEMIGQIDEDLIRYYHQGLMNFGPRYTGSINCTLAGEYIYHAFEEMGLNVEFHEWQYAGFHSKNVVATLPSSDPSSIGEYILCGHYDTVAGAPGADDDGSGTAAVLAIASVLRNYQFNHTIRFITFSGEEVGTYGSFSYAREASYRGDNIIAVLNMDMIGYANTAEGGRTLRFFPPDRSIWVAQYARQISQKYSNIIDMTVDILPAYRGADNQAFVDYGYDGVWIAHQDGYPFGHSPEDTPEHLNWSYYVKATKLMIAITAEIAQKPLDIQVFLRRPYEGHTYLFKRVLFESSFGKKYFAGLRGLTFIFGGKTLSSVEVFSDEPIRYVVFSIDGYFIFWDSEPPYEWTVQGWFYPINGRHILNVYAYTVSGKMAYDEMDIFMISLATSYKS